MARVTIYLLGPYTVRLGGEPVAAFHASKVRALLAYLAAKAGRPQGRADPAWQNRMPEYKAAAPHENRIDAGYNAQRLFTVYGAHLGGIYQIVSGIEPGSTIRFTIWGHAWAGSSDDPYCSESGGPMVCLSYNFSFATLEDECGGT